jgi:hypothetical protein
MSGSRSFIDEIAEKLLIDRSGNLEDLTIIFPNRRAGLFFTKALAGKIKNPIWSPKIVSFEDFVYSIMNCTPGDNLSLLLDMHDVFKKVTGFDESFDKFYFWGDMLLKDFNEIDKNLVRAKSLFTTIKNLKEIDVEFAFLSDSEMDALQRFWGNALNNKTQQKDSFIRFWANLYPVYRSFQAVLKKEGKAYSGMIYRALCDEISSGKLKWEKGSVIFAGFNALAPSEELIIKWFIESSSGDIFWDLDSYYFDNPGHEAGLFLRQYYKDKVFGKTFPGRIPNHFKEVRKEIKTIASSQYSGQTKIAGSIIQELIKNQGVNEIDNAVVVLPDENLLSQILYSLPASLNKVNITMGYPLANSSFFSLIDKLLELQENRRSGKERTWFNYQQVLSILNHHFIIGVSRENAEEIIGKIEKKNIIYVPSEFFSDDGFLSAVFDPHATGDLFGFLVGILLRIRRSFDSFDDEKFFFEKEFSIVFYKLLKRLNEIFEEKKVSVSPAILRRIIKNYSQLEKIPFSGEPLEGLQMMGLMETRNLDFKNVIILCANEGQLPNTGSLRSFIPYNIRKAFRLPNPDTQDAIYSYLYYRLLQRSSNVYMIYNTEESYTRPSEPSRYIYQLKFESGYKIHRYSMALEVSVSETKPIVIKKDDFINAQLARFYLDKKYKFSPSSLNLYLSCPLSFYYRNILDVREEEEVSEDLDAAKFGNILHQTMEDLYRPFVGKELNRSSIKDIRKGVVNSIKKSFAKYYGQDYSGDFSLEGKNILGLEIIKNYILKILEKDEEACPFEIIGIEQKYSYDFPISLSGKQVKVGLRGIIDRVDLKNGVIRIMDYKTGKDESSFKDIPGLFDGNDDNRNKAIFQTFFYAFLFLKNNLQYAEGPIITGLCNLKELYSPSFDPRIKLKAYRGSACIDDILPFMDDYESHLSTLISEIFDPDIPFRHREDQDKCFYCQNLGMPSDINK